MDEASILRSIPPFDALPRERFDEAARAAVERRFPAGAWLAHAGGEPMQHLFVIREGSVRIERHGQTVQVLEEGETFGYTSLITGKATFDVVVEEALVAFELPAAVFRRLEEDPRFAAHFAAGLGERLRASLEQSPVAAFQPDLSSEAGRLVRGPPIWVGPDATVVEAARAMRDHRISSVLVRGDPPGILTDRDLRSRVVAEGLGGDVPVARVATRPLWTMPEETPVYEAWMALVDQERHHLALVRDGEVVGVVTSTDLMRSSAQGPVAAIRAVERLASRDGLRGYGARVAEMVSALLAARLDPVMIAGLVARLNDALLRPILRWAEADLGPAPAPWAWLALGSEGRKEQTLLTDQDNALAFADDGAGARAWFQAFAGRVNDDLEAAGFPRCRGGYMARNWLGTVAEWRERFRTWIHQPSQQGLLEAAIFFDHRRVAGRLDLEPLQEEVAAAGDQPIFLRAMAVEALRFAPPQMLLLRMRGGASVVDLKKQGISPIVFLARCYALETRSRARHTLDRIDAAVRAGLLDAEAGGNVSEAYRFLVGLRLRLQLRMLVAGRPVVDEVALSELTPLERTRLKESFRAVKAWQDLAAYHHRI
ncbi:MAG: cyclic nucleotide-binding domain (cNMP-BD) protein [Anaeromyxobacteraceae bacterium]|nr:cyclic nucleotide-binding domain (cNMP-BD) protein [Anaeromyxobacteraceae bacterium]